MKPSEKNKTFWAGARRLEITPPVGSALSGFIARLKVGTAISGRLFVRALVTGCGKDVVVLVQMDLLGLAQWHVDQIRRYCQRLLKVPPQNVLVSTTHTHSGPGMLPLRGCAISSLEYQWTVVIKAAQAVREAYGGRQPARIRINRVPFRLGINRREATSAGMKLGTDARKPAPRHLDILHIRMGNGESCILFSHAAHPYILGPEDGVISGDFPGFACQFLEGTKGVTALFLNGCAGDIAPTRAFEGLQAAKKEGYRLAAAVLAATHGAEGMADHSLAGASELVYLPYRKLPGSEELEAMRVDQQQTIRVDEHNNPEIVAKLVAAFDDWALAMERIIKKNDALEPIFTEIQLIRIGQLCLVALSGEPFFSIGRHLRRLSPWKNTWILGYCNAYTGYLPTEQAFLEGGYEVSDSFRYLGVWQLESSAERRVLIAARKLFKDQRHEN